MIRSRGVEMRGQAGLVLLESLAALAQARFGIGVVLLARQTRAEEVHHIKPIARVEVVLFRQAQTFSQQRLGFGVILLS